VKNILLFRVYILIVFGLFYTVVTHANTLQGTVKDRNGKEIPYASIMVKKTTIGTTANSKGQYSLQLGKGEYIVVCQSIGFNINEQKIKIEDNSTTLNFVLEEQSYELKEVVVSNKAEDPAYEIIRNAIKKRPTYLKEFNNFKCQVYLKGQLQLRDYPSKFLGDTVDFEDGDTSKAKLLYLSETFADYSIRDNQRKVEITSTKVSGSNDGFGFGNPSIISFYENIIDVNNALNPRGFISPIADNALNYYKYKYMGSFYENGLEICRIKVTPRRKQEPLFTGYITIIDGRWNIHSVQLNLVKEQQLQLVDTVSYEQIYMQINNQWVVKQQVSNVAGSFLGFKFYGSFLQVYNKYEINKIFDPKYFSNVVIKYLDSSNKKSIEFWDSNRPIALLPNEALDYIKKDSLEKLRSTPAYLDSVDRVRNRPKLFNVLITGYNYSIQSKKTFLRFNPLLTLYPSYFNPAEGRVMNFGMTYTQQFKKYNRLEINPVLRYGLKKEKLYGELITNYTFPTKSRSFLNVGFGNTVFQFNNNNPISEFLNSVGGYIWGRNDMKTYEASYFKIRYGQTFGHGIDAAVGVQYQNRKPMDNVVLKLKDKLFTPNYPTTLMNANLVPHTSLVLNFNVTWRPFSRYLELPDRLINLGSKYPTLNFNVATGLPSIMGSNVDFMKWRLTATQNLNLKLYGKLDAKFIVGGFSNANQVFAPDYQHYLGNEIAINNNYMNGFQLLPYYTFSNTASLYTESHFEYHLNGFISNKIPVFKKLNWFFVLGANTLNVNGKPNYLETFVSVEKIFKLIRIDFVNGYLQNGPNTQGIKFSYKLL
jgi:hypothetical protein